ncbi:ATP-binding protein [Mycolicibacterium litorale]|uniref:histidine kinase n=1 Tax=Mycolicibacterium litorale TaxID=758802 RepID=A0AAD1MRT9_9MYCO|nr:ATP-binding protein [Mycolicibacterium litorale]MCV7418641.1 cyclic nucleotide-binding domain-containing protein [Mycolicibacterium litorale]TDY05961.1 histidine kinase/DNA gyrase B/HSP90-like ATPase [Mycolicibacterium litorale]BBY14533.1 histidine kinase [Mycolicibacterium litorale]
MVDESAHACDIDELRELFLFEGLTADQLQRLCGNGTVTTLPAGLLCRQGDPATHFYVLLDGEILLSKYTGNRDIEMWTTSQRGAYCGAWSAFLPDDDVRYENNASLTRPSRLLVLDAITLGDFLRTEFPMATHLLVGHTQGRLHAGRILGPHERLVQLGQLTAGLTHELNNPAAAAVRAASALRSRITETRHRRAEVGTDTTLLELHDRVAEIAAKPTDLTTAQKSHLEEALGEWLDAHGVSDAWDHAATFAEAGIDIDWMERISASGCGDTPAALSAAVRSLSSTVETELLLTEIGDATKRISVLVDQVKQYSQLDRAPFDVADIHELLDSTLAMLSHRLGPGVTVVRDFDHGLPAVPCYAAELNQVWTNLINNALDAMPSGVLTLRTRRERDTVRVEVCDTGTGIPDDVLPRVFDPFFTTKPFGEGAGLGLDIAVRIVDRHGGSLWAESAPGDTRFVTTLPLTAEPG